jgi:hypothetical protein
MRELTSLQTCLSHSMVSPLASINLLTSVTSDLISRAGCATILLSPQLIIMGRVTYESTRTVRAVRQR